MTDPRALAYKTEADTLRRIVMEALAENQWQPIETAPKDGSYIMLYEDGMVRLGMYLSSGWAPAEIPIYVDSVGNRVVSRELAQTRPGCSLELSGFVYEPTHWRPLPEGPDEAPPTHWSHRAVAALGAE